MTLIYDASGAALVDTSNRICLFCGCTDARACPGGCSWSPASTPELQICTACEELAGALGGFACWMEAKLLEELQIQESGGKPRPDAEGFELTEENLPALLGQQLLIWMSQHPTGPHLLLDRWGRLEALRKAGRPIPPQLAAPARAKRL